MTKAIPVVNIFDKTALYIYFTELNVFKREASYYKRDQKELILFDFWLFLGFDLCLSTFNLLLLII